MSAKSIREADGKAILAYFLHRSTPLIETKTDIVPQIHRLAQLFFEDPETFEGDYAAHVEHVLVSAEKKYPFLLEDGQKFVAKPDMLIKRRGKSGLLKLNATWEKVKEWIAARAGKLQQVEHVQGYLTVFLVEPFLAHPQDTEYYINIFSIREGDVVLFTHEGGVDVGDVDSKAEKMLVPVDLGQFPSRETIQRTLLAQVPAKTHAVLTDFIVRLYAVYVECQFTYLEINPLVVLPMETGAQVHYLDLAAKLDQTAEFECGSKWAIARSPQVLGITEIEESGVSADHGPPMEFPAPFGRRLSKEEKYIQDLDAKTGASLKLTVFNPKGRIWTLVAGGGASVVYADAIASSGFAGELANYGEYSGAPTETQTYEYAKTVLDLMTRGQPDEAGKVLFIGGGIANFTNCVTTFRGIIRALKDFQSALHVFKVSIWVRRAGPNYQEALKMMAAAGEELELKMRVYGAECHVSGIVPMALA
ncbi:putative ATP-citrate synthase subunit 2 [Neolecta irregularis DAH-3]|uniref:ATP citrate synthase n=1 Tax=Neolecta irregularis (strain DAH-3) TaxID=1198029 RepID=A0A1U7LKY6_NEOID|nr:putative ATP-citrate synthase subunit 2 [Neolecta irregularis DAH-3]|eukprot:OLL23320.1 putative ATP-citrate synthase subunit 2 [Neolecta irregularis DAH-3]